VYMNGVKLDLPDECYNVTFEEQPWQT
jgi:hypothetical protein